MSFWPPISGETPIDPSGLRNRSITNRGELNIAEAEGIRKVVVKYLSGRPTARRAPFTIDWSQKLHHEMLGDVWEWAGQIRSCDLAIGIPFYNIVPELYSLLDDLKHWSEYKMSMVEQAARLHHRAVKIHPFENGNGRWSRLLANIWLKQNREPITDWPEQTIGGQSEIRDSYIAAVKAADVGSYGPLIEMHQRFSEKH